MIKPISKLLLSTSTAFYLLFSSVSAVSPGSMQPEPSPKMTRHVSLYVPSNDLEGQLAAYYPQEFQPLTSAQETAVVALRQTHAHYTGEDFSAFFTQHNENLHPTARVLEIFFAEFLRQNPNHDFTKGFLESLCRKREEKTLSPACLFALSFQQAVSRSSITESERDLMEHFPSSETYFGLLTEGTKSPEEAFSTLLGNYIGANEVVGPFEDSVRRHLALPVALPSMGRGFFGLSSLVRNYLRNIYLIGLPDAPRKAHGIQLSPYGFGIHDLLHMVTDPRTDGLISHVSSRYGEDGGDIDEFMRGPYTKIAVQRYSAVMGVLTEIYEHLVRKVLSRDGLEEYRKIMSGFFWIMHEALNFPAELYDMNDVDKIIQTITDPSSTTGLELDDEDESDPFETSPLTGESLKSDAKIIEWLRQNKGVSPQANVVVTRSPLFIDGKLMDEEGRLIDKSFPTLHYKWGVMDDHLGLLRLGGTRLKKTNLDNVEDPRGVAMSTLQEVDQAIKKHVAHFRNVALFFANYDPQGTGSLAQRYFRWHFTQEQWLEEKMPTQIQKIAKKLRELQENHQRYLNNELRLTQQHEEIMTGQQRLLEEQQRL